MSTTGQSVQKVQLKQDIQHELTTANQLLRLISIELQQIKDFTNPGGDFESTIKKNANLMKTLANLQNIDIANIPPLIRKPLNISTQENLHNGNNNTLNESEMEENQ